MKIKNKIIGVLNKRGKLTVAKNIFLATVIRIRNQRIGVNISSMLENSLDNVQPKVGFKNKKIAGAVYKIPNPYNNIENKAMAIKWLFQSIRKTKNVGLAEKTSKEIIESFEKKGETIKRKKELQKQIASNRANLKYM